MRLKDESVVMARFSPEYNAKTEPGIVQTRTGPFLWIVLLLFLACYFTTSTEYVGDTIRWADDAIGHANGQATPFWDFGHLLWRPWAYVGYFLVHDRYGQLFSDTPTQAVSRFLIQTNFVCSAATVLVLFLLLRRVASKWISIGVACSMICAIAFLNYSHSGAPYIPALLFSTLTLYLLILSTEEPEKGRRHAFFAGLSFAVAAGLWFPFALSGLGMLAVLCCWRPKTVRSESVSIHSRLPLIGVFLGALASFALLLFIAGAAAQGVRTFAQLISWIKATDNGWQQSVTAMRAITGFPRSVWSFSTDTILLKRALWHDPFNPANVHQLWAFRLAAKLGVYYLGVAATLWILWRVGSPAFFVLGAGALPLLLFAVILFEPSSPERLFPIFPYAFLAFAAALNERRRHVAAASFIALFLIGVTTFNLVDNWTSTASGRLAETRLRIEALDKAVQPGALVFVATLNDDLYYLPSQTPLDHSLAFSRFHVLETVIVADQSSGKWRAKLAQKALDQWSSNREVWISARLLSPRPNNEWKWVEGDDKRLHWADIPAMFRPLQFDEKVMPARDGFLRIAANAANRERMEQELHPTTVSANR